MHAQASVGTALAFPRIHRVAPWITTFVTVWAIVAAGLLATAPSQTVIDRQGLLSGATLNEPELRSTVTAVRSPGRTVGQEAGRPFDRKSDRKSDRQSDPMAQPTRLGVRPSASQTVVARH